MSRREWSKVGWRRYAAFAVLVGGPFGSYDLVTHRWTDAAITLGSTAATLLWTRKGFRVAAQREAHRPDYAKIARLEVELGLVDPPPPPVTEPVVQVSGWDPNGFGYKTYGVRDKPKRAPNGHRCWAPGPDECYSDCGIMSWGQCPQRPKE